MSETTSPHRRRALGRGLGALLSSSPAPLPTSPADTESGDVLREIPIDEVAPNPEQPRRAFDDSGLAALADSIRLHGLLQPIVVEARPEGGYRLVAGERRLRAARLAGLRSVPAVVRPASESARQALELALVENLQRTDLSPIEEAAAFARLADTFGLSHDAIARRVGRSRPAVSNAIRLLGLPPSIQVAVHEGRIPPNHARALLALPTVAQQEALARRIEAEKLTTREVEHIVASVLAGIPIDLDAVPSQAGEEPGGDPSSLGYSAAGPSTATGAAAAAAPATLPRQPPLFANDEALRRGLEHALGTPVRLERKRRGGRIVIEFFTDEQLDGLYQRLGGPPL